MFQLNIAHKNCDFHYLVRDIYSYSLGFQQKCETEY